jgi:hypothetical protein
VQDAGQAKIGVGDHARIKITGWISNTEIVCQLFFFFFLLILCSD